MDNQIRPLPGDVILVSSGLVYILGIQGVFCEEYDVTINPMTAISKKTVDGVGVVFCYDDGLTVKQKIKVSRLEFGGHSIGLVMYNGDVMDTHTSNVFNFNCSIEDVIADNEGGNHDKKAT